MDLHSYLKEKALTPYEPQEYDFMAINIKAIHVVGLWNYHWKKKNQWRYYAYCLFSSIQISILAVHTVTQFLDLCINSHDMATYATTAWLTINYFAATTKQVFFVYHRDELQDTTLKLKGGILSKGLRWSKEQDDIALKTHKQVRTLSLIYDWMGVICVIGIVSIAIQSSYYKLYAEFTGLQNYTGQETEFQLPLQAWLPFDIQKPGNYLIAFTFQVTTLLIGPIVNIGTDGFMAGLMIHACGEFRILKHSLKMLKRRARQLQTEETEIRKLSSECPSELQPGMDIQEIDESTAKNDDSMLNRTSGDLRPYLYKALVECIQHHQEIHKFISELEEIFCSLMFIQFLSISVRLCLNVISMTLSGSKLLVQMTNVPLISVTFMQGLLYCWFGSELTYQSESVARVIYETPFLEASYRFKRNIIIMMMRAQKRTQMTGGKIYVLSLDTFQALVYASFSFFRLLQEFA
ncbi:Odorant receptor 74 [Blattella germanica]|nr:Odorant receptor 74 [Blattella germanica]